MIVGVLGPLEVEHEGRELAVGGGRLRALLARLALDAGRPVTSGALVDAVWDTELPADQVHSLQSLVSRLRRALGEAELVAQVPGGYVLDAEVDAQRFEALVGEARGVTEAERRSRLLDAALALWRGPALADLGEYRFAVAAAARLEDARLSALADRAEAALALGRGAALVGELEALCAAHPLHERLAAQLLGALYAAGRQADALAAYERVRTRLMDELGVSPSSELQSAHMAVLRGETAAPPAAAVRAARTNLPAPVTSFVGREREIAHIGELLERSRLVTLVGPGGAGKTRLAREAVAGWVDRVADGAWMVELAPVTAEVEVVPAILGALGVRDAAISDKPLTGRDTLERLLDILADRESLLLLDNCEHLIAAVAELAEKLLGACPRLRIVATSREALAIAGESLAPVPPLGLPEPGATAAEALAHPAVRLFADRAAAALPGFTVDDASAAAVIEICRRLDGLPLALELAAARLRSLPLDELAERLDDRFRLLTGGSRTALPRHRTLRAVVDWSWELLTDAERTLARRLAVFPAGATVESAAAVGGDFDDLVALVDRSLLQLVPGRMPVRYRMLETIREYGIERLEEAGELEEARTAHARYFGALVERAEPRLRRSGQKEWFARLDDERENILAALRQFGDSGDKRAALRLAVQLLWFWLLSGSQAESMANLRFALEVPGEGDPTDEVIASCVHMFEAFETITDREELRTLMLDLLDRAEFIDDTERPLVAIGRPVFALFADDAERGQALRERASTHPDPWVRAAMHMFNAGNAENEGDIEGMGSELAAARAGFAELGDSWGLGMALFLEAGRMIVAGDLAGARTTMQDAQRELDGLSPENSSGMLDYRMADITARLGDFDAAREHARRARERRDIGTVDIALAQSFQARVEWAAGNAEGATEILNDALERLARRGPVIAEQRHSEVIVGSLLAMLAAEAGDVESAQSRLATAYPAAMATRDMPVVSLVGVAAAYVAQARGREQEAGELLGAAAVVRGAEDLTSPEISRLHAKTRPDAYARGRALPREEAMARLEAAALRAAPVGG